MTGKGALIDADSLCYICSKETIQESIDNIDSMLVDIINKVNADWFVLFLSEGKYFRHDIDKNYKAQRPSTTPLIWTKTLKAYLREKYSGIVFRNAEADDLVAYFIGKYPNSIVCSADKDVLKSISGRNYNYRTKEFIETNEEEALKFTFIQTLMGDAADNIKGIPGCGIKTAEKILADCKTLSQLQAATFDAYKQHHGNLLEAVREMTMNFRLVYLLKTDEDFLRECGSLPVLDKVCMRK